MREMLKLMVTASIALSAIVTAAVICDAGSKPGDDGSNLVGNWTGDSICVGPFPACHDEKVIYRIPKAPDATGKVTITADKIVNGKPETMGVLDFKYDSEKGTLTCEFTRGSTHGLWEFTVKENTMEGTLVVLPDKTLARRVKLKKEAPTSPGSANGR